jgi:carboxyl-terminal processing protease
MKKRNLHKLTVPILSIIVVILVFSIGYVFGRSGFNLAWEDGEFEYSFKGRLYPEEKEVNFDLFWEVWEMLETRYVDKALDEEDMFYGAIKGMVSALGDPNNIFLTSQETSEYEESKSGLFEGIGIEMGYLNGEVLIKKVFVNSPAQEADIRAGDVIEKVDGSDISDLTLSEVAQKIRGESGTQVLLSIKRNGEELETEVTRGEVYVESVEFEMLDSDIALITVRRFTEDSYMAFTNLWDSLILETYNQNPTGIIIDLRGNGGGYLSGAVYLAGEFINNGSVVLYVQDRDGNQEAMKVDREGKFKEIPVVVLVDSGTASSAEIFAGALQYYDRVIVVGEETYGKGTAQDIVEPASWGGASMHITTQKWLLPDKRWINSDNPIKPDIEIEFTLEEFKAGEDPQLDKAVEEINE